VDRWLALRSPRPLNANVGRTAVRKISNTRGSIPMNDSESFELIALCEEILDDEEVTVAEVSRLGEWLAAHEEARRTWPGEVLAAPVQETLLDGKVNETELRRVSSLLRRVQKEWVGRREELVQQNAMERAASVASSLDLSVAMLPSIPVTLRVKSHSDKTVIYDVDLAGPSCNCADWRGARSQLPKGSLTRCCKHIFDAFGRLEPTGGWPGWLGAFLEQGWKPHPGKRWLILRLGSDLDLSSVGGNDWSDIFAVVGGGYQRFGYNIAERRWSYGREPPRSNEIEKAILGETHGRDARTRKPGLFDRLFGR
jgi:hypothetical protein